MATHNDIGKRGEEIAVALLEEKGYAVLHRNYRFQQAEVDIVAMQLAPEELVFVEVKARSGTYGPFPEAAVTPAKQKRILKSQIITFTQRSYRKYLYVLMSLRFRRLILKIP